MSFSSVFKKEVYYKYAECAEGTILAEGYYKGTREGTFGTQFLFDCGETVVVLNKAGQLSWLLGQINQNSGRKVRVVYKGQQVLTKGRFKNKPVHQFEVLVDSEDCS